jgi:hypothetical protein
MGDGSVRGGASITQAVNRFGYSELKIEFQSKDDRKEFLKIWGEYVKPFGVGAVDAG